MKKYIFPFFTGTAAVILCALSEGLFISSTPKEFVGTLSDCFFVPGVLLTGAGMLVMISYSGIFDMLGYSIKKAVYNRKKFEHLGYYEYKCEVKKKRTDCRRTLFSGLIFLFFGIALCFLYSVM